MCFAYAINIGVLRKGCVLQHKRGTPHRKAECGAGVPWADRARALLGAQVEVVVEEARHVVLAQQRRLFNQDLAHALDLLAHEGLAHYGCDA